MVGGGQGKKFSEFAYSTSSNVAVWYGFQQGEHIFKVYL